MTPEARAADLFAAGYEEVEQVELLRPGVRVRHVGQQYPEARRGTATVERIFVRDVDVELIVKRDKPEWGPNDTHGYWADYHTIVIPQHNQR